MQIISLFFIIPDPSKQNNVHDAKEREREREEEKAIRINLSFKWEMWKSNGLSA
jgi:hypothetical protein